MPSKKRTKREHKARSWRAARRRNKENKLLGKKKK